MRSFVLCSLLLPALYIIVGLVEILWPPKKRNVFFGYRTARSKLSQDTWDYANHSFGIVCIFLGIYMAFATGVIDAFARYATPHQRIVILLVVMIIQLVCLIYPVYYTEHHLKIFFNEEGELLFPEKLDFKHRRSVDEWEDWNKWPEDKDWEDWKDFNLKDDGWESWDEWVYRRDLELDKEREARLKKEKEAGDTSVAQPPEKDSGETV